MKISLNDLCLHLQAKIAVLENLPTSQVRLFSAGSPLEEEAIVSSLSSTTLDVTVPLLGGMTNCQVLSAQFD